MVTATRPLGLLVCCLLVTSALAGIGAARPTTGSTTTATASDAATLDRRFVVSLTPDDPGTVRVQVRFDVPDDVTTLSVRLPGDARVRATDGFARRGESTYDWTRTTDRPSITYGLSVNRTISRGIGEEETGGYLYVDAGAWALFRAPSTGITYSGTGDRPRLNTTYGFTGSGATGGGLVFLGRHREVTRTAATQRFRLVVPAAADMRESPSAVLDSLSNASRALAVGPRDEEVVAIAAPTTVEWAATGLQVGAADFWVMANQRLDRPGNPWLHEYVHTRQVYVPTDATRWTVEGMADYYAALLTYRQGRIDYGRFRDHLERGQAPRYDDVVLAEPSTWRGTLAAYDKGALVMGALDRQIRLNTDGSATLADALRRFDDDESRSQEAFLAAVEAVGGEAARRYARKYTETSATPDTWSRRAHRRAFGGGATFAYAFVPPYERTGPFRNDATDATPTVVINETLAVRVAVENVGGANGEYHAVLRADGETLATTSGTLAPGERAVLTFHRTFTDPGVVRLTVGGAEETVTVRRPADVRVTRLAAPRRASVGERVTVRATVAPAADRPAAGAVWLTAGDRTLAVGRVTLAAGETATLSGTTTFDAPGEYVVAAGGRSRTVRVGAGTPSTATRSGTATRAHPSPTPTPAVPDGADPGPKTPNATEPGFGLAAGAAALLVAGLIRAATRD